MFLDLRWSVAAFKSVLRLTGRKEGGLGGNMTVLLVIKWYYVMTVLTQIVVASVSHSISFHCMCLRDGNDCHIVIFVCAGTASSSPTTVIMTVGIICVS